MLKCVDCGADFVFTAGEQIFFHDKQFKNLPKRCKACKQKRSGAKGTANRFDQAGNRRRLLGLRKGNDASVPSHPGPASVLPRVFREAEGKTGAHA